eukprot:6202594-Pleurochrysis_carterae.AAC.1
MHDAFTILNLQIGRGRCSRSDRSEGKSTRSCKELKRRCALTPLKEVRQGVSRGCEDCSSHAQVAKRVAPPPSRALRVESFSRAEPNLMQIWQTSPIRFTLQANRNLCKREHHRWIRRLAEAASRLIE